MAESDIYMQFFISDNRGPNHFRGPPHTPPLPAHGGPIHSVVRDAMVSIMQASAPENRNVVASTPPAHDSGDGGDHTGECWSATVTAGGPLPRDSSTCILWCAISLGGLVSGRPLSYVGVEVRCVCRLFPNKMLTFTFPALDAVSPCSNSSSFTCDI